MSFVYGQNVQGGAGVCHNVGPLLKGFVMLVSSFGALQAIWKGLNLAKVFQGLNGFERPQILRLMLFCRIWQNVAIHAQKCSSTAQNRGGAVQPIWTISIFRLLFLQNGFTKGSPPEKNLLLFGFFPNCLDPPFIFETL